VLREVRHVEMSALVAEERMPVSPRRHEFEVVAFNAIRASDGIRHGRKALTPFALSSSESGRSGYYFVGPIPNDYKSTEGHAAISTVLSAKTVAPDRRSNRLNLLHS
jgi:hypothetical protein